MGTLISTSCIVALQGRHTEQCASLQSIEKEQQTKKEIFVVKVVTAVRTGNFLHRILTRWISVFVKQYLDCLYQQRCLFSSRLSSNNSFRQTLVGRQESNFQV